MAGDELASPFGDFLRLGRAGGSTGKAEQALESWPFLFFVKIVLGHLVVESHSCRRVGRWRCHRVQVHVSVPGEFEISDTGILRPRLRSLF